MKESERERWKFTAAYRLGRHWQATGDYVRAYAAYAEAQRLSPRHSPTLYNLAVVAVRLGFYGVATESLDALCRRERFPEILVSPAEGGWSDHYLPVAYQRALILDYERKFAAAAEWSRALAVRLTADTEASDTIRLPALMLYASTVIQRDAGTSLPEETARAVVDGADGKALDLESPAEIFAFVRRRARADTRTHYNLACFLSRLAGLAPHEYDDELAELVVDEAQQAMSDAHLIEWAKRDPALDAVRKNPRWVELIQRIEPSDSGQVAAAEAPDGATTAAPEPQDGGSETPSDTTPAPRVSMPRRSPRGRLIDRAAAILRGVCAVQTDPRGLEALASLRPRAAELSARRFAIELAAAVAAAGDPGTVYHLPRGGGGGDDDEAMTLPFTLAEVNDGHGGTRIVLADGDAGVPPGTELTHWNELPILEAVELRAERIAAASRDARRARALASLPHRPAGLIAPFAEEHVRVRWRDELEATYRWEPAASDPSGTTGRQPWSIDPLVEALQLRAAPSTAVDPPKLIEEHARRARHLRLRTFAGDAEPLWQLLDGVLPELPPAAGLLLDLRGNPGGSVEFAGQLLSALGVPLPDHVEIRDTAAAQRLVRSLGLKLAPNRRDDEYATLPLDLPRFEREPFRGPVVVIVDGLCSGAAAFFARQFQCSERGKVLSSVPRPGLTTGLTARASVELFERGWFSTTFARFADFDTPFAPSDVYLPTTSDEAEMLAAAVRLLPEIDERAELS